MRLHKLRNLINKNFLFIVFVVADDDCENSPHDLEGNNSDLEYGNDGTFLFKGNSSSFTQMQVNFHQKQLKNFCTKFYEIIDF